MNEQPGSAAGGDLWFRKGSEAMQASQWDYAVECFCNAVNLQPHLLHYRQAKHRSSRRQQKAAPRESATSGTARSVRLVDIRRKLLQAKLRNDWLAVDRYAEQGLTFAPSDPHLFAYVAAAAVELQHTTIARYAWSMAIRLDRTNEAYHKAYGRFLAAQRDFDAAQKCFQRVLALQPADRYASEMLRYIDVERLIHCGGYGQSARRQQSDSGLAGDSMRPPVADADDVRSAGDAVTDATPSAANGSQPSPDDVRSNRTQRAVDAQARHCSELLKAARLCVQSGAWQRAADVFREVLERSPDDVHVREEYEDAVLSQLRGDLEKLLRAAQKNPKSQLLQERAVQQERCLLEQRVLVYQNRVRRYSSDLNLKFALAEDFSRLGRYTQAIPLYQQCCQHGTLREQSLLKLGQCWICDGKRDLASRQFLLALKSLSAKTNPDAWKTAHYWLGRIEESSARTEAAVAHYSEVLLLDYDFRDTVARLESLQPAAAAASNPLSAPA